MLSTLHHSASALDFKRKELDFDVSKERIKEFFGELGFDVKTSLWGGASENRITVVHRLRNTGDEMDFGFTDLEKAIYVTCVILKDQQESPITEDLVIDHLSRKKDENCRLVISKKNISPTLKKLEDRGILVKVKEGEYDKGWNWDVFFDPELILGMLEEDIKYDQKYRPQLQSNISDYEGGEDVSKIEKS
jgi:DNA-binding transcriptional ArsR family regulator